MQEFKFNYCIPREYKDKETKEIKYALFRGGEKMTGVATLDEIKKAALVRKGYPKEAQPWLQIFTNGYRVDSNNLDWSEWNGFTWTDIDSKYYYDTQHPFNVNKLLKAIIDEAPYLYPYNYYCCHITNSNKGYRIFWYWECERTEVNFRKCALLSEQYTRNLFYSFGKQAKEIIDFKLGTSPVLDKCGKSVFQGSYMTTNDIHYSDFIGNADFGSCNLEDISLEQIYQINNIIKINGDFDQKKYVTLDKVLDVDVSSIRYYPHSHRRCIYEALIVLFDKKEIVDEQWKRIAYMLPETDGMNGGHSHKFYEKEPSKNKWYERFNSNIMHNVSWLNEFGYTYTDESEYVYKKQFQKSWKKHIESCVKSLYIDKKIKDYNSEKEKNAFDKLKKNEKEEIIEEYIEDYSNKYTSIFDNKLDDFFTDEEDKEKLDDYRREYYKTKWGSHEFRYLCYGYDIPKDIVTYKMYADFYYRDNNNIPNIKYNILEDEVKLYGYWPETNKFQYHSFKYGDEYTHWKNNDTFNNQCNSSDLLKAVNKYVQRWHNYHSIKDYLNSLDLSQANEELLETWAIRYFKADDTKLTREICKKYFIAAVKKQFIEDPTAFVFQHMLFLQGPTGCGKTYFLVIMFTINGHSYILNKIDPNGKDNEIGPLIAKNWLIQFGESESLKKVSVNAAKEFLDRINLGMKYQKKYENEQTTVYPRIMACRTSNDDVLFNDVSINEGDRRNWLIVCKTGVNSCDEKLRELIRKEKDIIWATAYKLYLDNPDQDLELSGEAFNELSNLQEEYKLIKTDDVEEVYNDIFERNYLTNSNGFIQDEYAFYKMADRSDTALKSETYQTDEFFETNNEYNCIKKIDRIPSRWLHNYIQKKYGVNFLKVFKDCLKRHKWMNKTCGYNNTTMKCWQK